MRAATKQEWSIAEAVSDADESFVLWMLDAALCSSRDDFRSQFGADLLLDEIVGALVKRGLISEHAGNLQLSEQGAIAVKCLQATELEDLRDEPRSNSHGETPMRTGPITEDSATTPADVLMILGVQQDHFRGGVLEIAGAETLIDPLNEAISDAEARGMTLIFVRDWHPSNHRSFRGDSPDGQWPPHCVQYTDGAKFHPRVYLPARAQIISMGTDGSRFGDSAFEDESLAPLLESHRGRTLYIAGLPLEYCVQMTAVEAVRRSGLRVVIIESLVRAASAEQPRLESIWSRLEASGIERRPGPPARTDQKPTHRRTVRP